MSLADVSIKRPVFITCVIIVMIAVGLFSMKKLGVDLFPNVTFPVVTVTTVYPGSGPAEIETLVSKPLEEEISTLAGIKRLSSINQEGVSTVIAEFTLETDIKFAEQQIRDRTGAAKRKLPKEIDEPVIRRIDPSDQPVLIIALDADLPAGQLYDLANEVVKPKIEQVDQVGQVEIIGGRKREIFIELDRKLLKSHEISALQISNRLAAAGQDIPVGKIQEGKRELVFRSLGQFKTLKDIESAVVNFFGSDVPVTVADIGSVRDHLKDEKSRAFINGQKSLFIYIFKQSGTNTIKVVDSVLKQLKKMESDTLKTATGSPKVTIVRDSSNWIRANIKDVQESILIGITLAVIVVFFFLGSGRSTIITGLALPNSLIGAFVLMALAGFTINIMSLLALSLAVGLLVDDAIVVRENIFRHLELGKSPHEAARIGTAEVRLAVIATTLTVLAVFGPVGFLKGVTGQFFREFGLTICFAMAISLFDALTIAPMLSAYFAGKMESHGGGHSTGAGAGKSRNPIQIALKQFSKFQDALEKWYGKLLTYVLHKPIRSLVISFLIAQAGCMTSRFVPKTFLPAQDAGEFSVKLDLPPGSNLDEMTDVALKADDIIRSNKEVVISAITVGNREGEANQTDIYVKLVPFRQRPGLSTSDVKERLREQLKSIAFANPRVADYDAVGGGMRPFNINFIGNDQAALETYSLQVFEWLKTHKGLKDPDISFRPGKPEFQFQIDPRRADQLGVSAATVGGELRNLMEGTTPALFRENGREYDIRVRLREDQRNLKEIFDEVYVPNINFNLIRVASFAKPVEAKGPSKITRQDRSRYVQISADIAPGAGLANIMQDIDKKIATEFTLPAGVTYRFVGQAENMEELSSSMATAVLFGVLFIFLVLASLYESFVTPLTIMLALPLAMVGSFVSLALAGESLNIFSMIGAIMLLGVAAKNSILLVDYAQSRVLEGANRIDAMIEAGKTRLRPILMTTLALISGTIPIAIGLNEASKQRTSMGWAIIGGLVSSTLLTLVVVPAAYLFLDRFRIWARDTLSRWFGVSAG